MFRRGRTLRFPFAPLRLCVRPLFLCAHLFCWSCFLLSSFCAYSAPAEPQRVTLPDGVRLVLKPETGTDVVAIVILVRTEENSVLDEARAELVAHALFFGSKNRSYDSVMRSLAEVGGALETARTPDYVAVTCVTVPEQLRGTVYMLCEAIKNADFTSQALDRATRSLLAERRRRAADGYEMAYAALREGLRGYAEPREAALNHVTQAQAQDYFVRHYVPAKTVVAVVGNFDAEQARRAFDADFFDYTRPLPARRAPDAPPIRPDASLPPVTLSAPGTAAYAMVGTLSPSVVSPDYPAFVALQSLLGGGHASRLFRQVRDTSGFGYDVGTVYAADRSDPLVAYLQWDTRRALTATETTQPLKSADALALLNAQLDKLLAAPPSDTELTRARNLAIGRDALRHERARDRAFFLGWYEAMGLGYAFDADLPRRLAAVTPDDLQRVAKKYLSVRASVVAMPPMR